ncbi:hypothetical protein OEA41_005542 [Lepraria neglecta]|uniref:Uncharacterized protein n=1 Tax=Lepraria neglecta TaxID=209136 RepID=A0AAE0DQJ0_9LECA|nr:hypothetical protein OEA41_005542 [Lepraria neglecta]
MVWVRADLMRWRPLPYFSQHALENLGLTQDYNAFQKSFRRYRIARLLNKEHYFYSLWREHCETYSCVPQTYEPLERWVKRTLDLAAQLVVREYNLEVFDILAKRCYIAKRDWKDAVRSRKTGPCPVQDEWPSKAIQKEYFLAQIDDEDSRNGLCMLTPGLVTRITGAGPILFAREPRAPTAKKPSSLTTTSQAYGRIESAPSLDSTSRNYRVGGANGSDANDNNTVFTRQRINKTPMVQRTNWLSCRLDAEHHPFVDRVDRAVNDSPTQKAISRIIRDGPLYTLTNTNSDTTKYLRGVFRNLVTLDNTFLDARMYLTLVEQDSKEGREDISELAEEEPSVLVLSDE